MIGVPDIDPAQRLLVVLDVPTARSAGHQVGDLCRDLLAAGARRFWYRHHGADGPDGELLRHVQTQLLSAGGVLCASVPAGLAADLALGHHLSATDRTIRHGARGPVGASCHNESELETARAIGADYVTVSPVWPTTSPKHTARPPLGVDRLAELCSVTPVPVYALGGVRPGRVAACRRAGAFGVAVLGAVCLSQQPARVVEALLDELRTP